MEGVFNIVNIVGGICSIISFFSTVLMYVIRTDKKGEKGKRAWWVNCLYSMIFLVVCASLLSMLYLLVEMDSDNKDKRLMCVLCLISALAAFILYAFKAIKSLDGRKDEILPPAMFWQMLMNKVPSNLEDQMSENRTDMFAVVSMDDSYDVKNAIEKISSCYDVDNFEVADNNMKKDSVVEQADEKKKKKRKKVIKIGLFRGYNEGDGVFTNINETLNKTDIEIRGVFFLVGPSAAQRGRDLKECISAYARSHKENPIVCYWSPQNKDDKYILPYEQIEPKDFGDFVRRLGMRGFRRNYLQVNLSRVYQKTFIAQGVLLLLLTAGIIFIANSSSPYFRPKWLENEIAIFDSIDFEKDYLLNDTGMVDALVGFSNYYFSDLEGFKKVKLWYNNTNGLICVLTTEKEDSKDRVEDLNKTIGKDSMKQYIIGSVVDEKLFVLWPGENNIFVGAKEKMVWDCDGDDDKDSKCIHGEIRENNDGYYWNGYINDEKPIQIYWHRNRNSPTQSKEYAAFFFSYDGRLAVEIRTEPYTFKSNNYKYMSHLMFRNSVRKYMYIVAKILSHPKYKNALKTEETPTGTTETPLNKK